MQALKAQDKGSQDEQSGQVMQVFRGYDLSELPHSARPRAGETYHGKHGYTLKCPSGAATRPNTFWNHNHIGCIMYLYMYNYVNI